MCHLQPLGKADLDPSRLRRMLTKVPRFNSTEGQEENLIVTGNGQFVVAWDFNKVKRGKLDKYEIQRYGFIRISLFDDGPNGSVQVCQEGGAGRL
jgi:VID27 C-terminal WD40-like domain